MATATPTDPSTDDLHHMRVALTLARRGLGAVWPNPSVGCVVVNHGRVAGRGWTQPGGRPHAESEALGRAGSLAKGATAYVSLEPCAHRGNTPPCADALIDAGIARLVAATEDPDPRTAGAGLTRLRDTGVAVDAGLCEAEAKALNAGFFLRVTSGRPLFTLKSAATLDGRIATHGGESRWITGEAARMRGHALRASHDAVMVGSGTALADDPMLDCRLPGLASRSPVRIVLDSRLRLPPAGRLASTAGERATWVVTVEGSDAGRRAALRDRGIEVIEVGGDGDGRVDLDAAAAALGGRGLTRVLVEGGATLAAALLRRGLADRLVWFRNPRLIGGDGLPAAAAFGVDALADAPAYRRLSITEVGDDLMETYERII